VSGSNSLRRFEASLYDSFLSGCITRFDGIYA
jgi:hypothetical protein